MNHATHFAAGIVVGLAVGFASVVAYLFRLSEKRDSAGQRVGESRTDGKVASRGPRPAAERCGVSPLAQGSTPPNALNPPTYLKEVEPASADKTFQHVSEAIEYVTEKNPDVIAELENDAVTRASKENKLPRLAEKVIQHSESPVDPDGIFTGLYYRYIEDADSAGWSID